MSGTVKIVELTVDGVPYLCPECGSPGFTLDGGLVAAFPADANCDYSHHWTDPAITTGDLPRIRAASSGREYATDEDTFQVVIRGSVLAGTLHPQVTVDDVRQAGGVYWRRILKPGIRRKRRAAERAVIKPVKAAARKAKRKVTDAADDAVASTKAAALGAAWDLQTGGHESDPNYTPEPVIPCGAGCDNGYFHLDTRIYEIPEVQCTVCRGTGETL
ncbi:hypothetical protein [Streptomyces flavofungini]|uniref:hypothetical protein n=1 Tax=Streptomyces flavofungini TaxID=68200 RepID=UPI0034E04F2E